MIHTYVPNKPRTPVSAWVNTAVLAVIALVTIGFPLYMTVVVSLKTPADLIRPLAFPTVLRFENFSDAFRMTNFPVTFRNTSVITVVALAGTVITNSVVAYAIGRNRNRSRLFRLAYYYFVSAMFIPFNIIMLPLVKQVSMLYLDNVAGITLLYVVFGVPMNTFLLTGYLKSMPTALDEAAKVDGAGVWTTFFRIIFPNMKPILATVAILSFMWTWNDFMMPLVLLSEPGYQTLQLAQYVFQGQFSTDYNLAFASYSMALIPVFVVYVVFHRSIISGVTAGAVKA